MIYFKTLLFIILPVFLFAQQPYLRNVTNENGLPSMIIYEMAQDHDGFLWIGTENGFCRYDGSEFIVYENDEAKDNEFIGVYTSPTNRTWCWNLSGQLFYVENNQLNLYQSITTFDNFGINKVIGDKKGNIWISNSKWFKFEYLLCDKDGNCSLNKNITGDKNIYQFLQQANSNHPCNSIDIRKLYYFFFPRDSKLTTFFKPQKGLTANFFFDSNNNINLYTNQNNVVKIGLKDNEFSIQEYPEINEFLNTINAQIYKIYVDRVGNWWLYTNNGLFSLSKDFKPLNNGKAIVSDMTINSFLSDTEGGYWIGTNGKGLYYMPNYNVRTFNKNNSILKDNLITEILSTQPDKIIAFTNKGHIYEIENEQINLVSSLNNTTINLIIPSKHQLETYHIIKNKRLFNTLDETFKPIFNQNLLSLGSIKDVYETDSSYFIGNQSHFFSFRKQDYNTLSIKKFNFLLEQRTYAIEPIYNGNLLIGTIKGLYTYDGKTTKPFLKDNEDINVWINDIKQSPDSTIWIATEKKGLYKINPDESIEHFQVSNGLSSNSCEKLYIDSLENVWITTNNGLSYYDKKANYISIVNQTNGLPSDLIRAVHVDKDDVWVGTTKGISIFNKKQLLGSTYDIPIKITKVLFDEVSLSIDSFYHIKENVKNIQFEFISSTFKYNGKIKYQFKMSGVDRSWQETTSNTVLYNNLRSGHYTFEVAALDVFGKRSDNIATIKIFIPTPYWQKWWFYLLAVIFSVGSLFAIIYTAFRMYKARKDKEIAISKKIGELRINALQSQMNPHFTFNALNAIQNFFTTNEREMAMMYLSKFARLIRLSFEYSKQSVISLNKEIDFLKLYLKLEELRFKDKIKCNFQTIDLINENDIMVPPLLIQPIVENAFKHGLLHKETGGKLDLIFKQEDNNTIHCTIEDNGIGRKNAAKFAKWKPKEYKSSGIQTVQERVDLINQEHEQSIIQFKITDLMDDANNPTGTKVEFWFKSLI